MKKIRISLILIFILFLGLSTNAFAYTGTAVTSEDTGISDTLLDLYETNNSGIPLRNEFPYLYISTSNYYFLAGPTIINSYNTYSDYVDNGYSHFTFDSTSMYNPTYFRFFFVFCNDTGSSLRLYDTVSFMVCNKDFEIISFYDSYSNTYISPLTTFDLFEDIISEASTATIVSNISADITNAVDNGDSVFQSPSTQTITLWSAETMMTVPEMMTEALKILIPVGLVLLSIGLVIFLVRLVIWRVQ